MRFLHFHEGAGLGFLSELIALAQVGPRSDIRRAADMGLLHAGTFHVCVGVDRGADQCGVRADLSAFANHRAPLKEAARKNHRVAADAHVILNPSGVRIENGHAVAHPLLAYADVVGLGERGELYAVVDAFHAQWVGRGVCADRAVGLGGLEGVGQVELALRVVGFQVGDGLGKQVRVENVYGGVHLVHGQFAAVGVFLFHDAQHVAFAVADDAAVSGRIIENGGEHGRAVAAALVEVEQAVQRFRVKQRHVGCRDEYCTV